MTICTRRGRRDLHTPSCGFGTFLRGLHEARTDDELATARAAFDQEPA